MTHPRSHSFAWQSTRELIQVSGLPKHGLGVALICFFLLLVSSPAHLTPTQPQALRVTRAWTRLTAPRVREPWDGWRFKSFPSGDPVSLTAAAQMRNRRQFSQCIHRGLPYSHRAHQLPEGGGRRKEQPLPTPPCLTQQSRLSEDVDQNQDLDLISSLAEFREDLKQDVYSSFGDNRGRAPTGCRQPMR